MLSKLMVTLLGTIFGTAMALGAMSQTAAPTGHVPPIDPAVWITPGARIPDVELPRVDGQGLIRLRNYEGKRLLLIQFASW